MFNSVAKTSGTLQPSQEMSVLPNNREPIDSIRRCIGEQTLVSESDGLRCCSIKGSDSTFQLVKQWSSQLIFREAQEVIGSGTPSVHRDESSAAFAAPDRPDESLDDNRLTSVGQMLDGFYGAQ